VCLLELSPQELKAVSDNQTTVQVHTSGEANAIPYWFELTWRKDETVSTRHAASHVCQAAMLLEPQQEIHASREICITARQQHGFIHLGIIHEM
jgi:hypothetical protein